MIGVDCGLPWWALILSVGSPRRKHSTKSTRISFLPDSSSLDPSSSRSPNSAVPTKGCSSDTCADITRPVRPAAGIGPSQEIELKAGIHAAAFLGRR